MSIDAVFTPTQQPIIPIKSKIKPEKPNAGLAPLLLTVTELIRQLMEAQVIRSMERGDLRFNRNYGLLSGGENSVNTHLA